MDSQKFLDHLPGLFEHWGGADVRPRSSWFLQVLQQVQGMTTPNVLQLLNWAVACLGPEEVYCEVGSFQGATLIGALLGHPLRQGVAIDNFAEFDDQGRNQAALRYNLTHFGLQERVRLHVRHFEEFFTGLREVRPKIGVYFYDGAHDYRSQLMGLLLARPFLADRALVVVDDTNWPAVRQANRDFLAAQPECRLLLDLRTPGNGAPTFWNGLQVLAWEARGRMGIEGASSRALTS